MLVIFQSLSVLLGGKLSHASCMLNPPRSCGHFVDKIKNLEVPPGQELISYDVSALFTSIPVPDAIKAVRIKLDEDPKLQDRTPLSGGGGFLNY